mgnify:CR=1 FL=1
MEEENNIDAQLHALHWAFFSSVMDKDFPELFAEFVTWCGSLSKEEKDDIMSDDNELDMEGSEEETTTHTEDEIWKSLSVN